MILYVHVFTPGALIGLLGPLFIIVAAIVGAWAFGRVNVTKAQAEAIATWRQNADAQEKRADLFEEKYNEQRELKHDALTELTAERLKTDQTIVLGEIVRVFDSLTLSREETASQLERMEKQLVGAIAEQTKMLGRQTEMLGAVAEKIIRGTS